ncbi:hypothetical protein MFLAVUS_002068 [Mucor flavus]|uniref:F-box domain-containing protein n=1 Tax=Mucor flavus TaxID=439312 RepID=A0ABP9YP93_9FUNG
MSQASRNECLPYKILKQIFQNLDEKEDHKTCLLVCRPWNSAAQEYFSRETSINVKETQLDDLFEDLSYFGQNVDINNLIGHTIDVHDLYLRVKAPQLKEVKLHGCVVITNDSPDYKFSSAYWNRSLTDLRIFSDNINISTLRYIVSLLKEVKILALLIGNVAADEDISVEESETILGDLEASTSEMKRVEIKYKYNAHDFYLNMGKEFKIKSRSDIHYRSESYSSDDDDSYYDDRGDNNDDCSWNGCSDDNFFYDD